MSLSLPDLSQTDRLTPPHNVPYATADGTNSTAWTDHNQNVADLLARQAAQLTTLAAQVSALPGQARQGVTDGSNAAPGDIGEYMTAAGAAVALATGTPSNLVTLNLTAGDWDVSGAATFSAAAGTHIYFLVGVGGVIDNMSQATFPSTALTQQMVTAVHRYSLTATTAVSVIAQAGFTGSVTASGVIRARRVR